MKIMTSDSQPYKTQSDDEENQPQIGGSNNGSTPIIAQPGAVVQNSQSGQQSVRIAIPDEAADTDLIEKEWVERAKQVVEHTAGNPYEQQRAISQMKADYMKKRYNKDIKLPEA
jgi:hypothetical protein